MGIEGLLPLFKPIMQVARIEIFENKTCVVDAMSWYLIFINFSSLKK